MHIDRQVQPALHPAVLCYSTPCNALACRSGRYGRRVPFSGLSWQIIADLVEDEFGGIVFAHFVLQTCHQVNYLVSLLRLFN
jgi:hypothetical protein